MTARRLTLAAKALFELGPGQLWHYARYRGALRLGILRRQTSAPLASPAESHQQFSKLPFFNLPDRERILALIGDPGLAQARRLADEIVEGKERLFGGDPVPLQLDAGLPLAHWTDYELGKVAASHFDYKQVWEPGRFGWGISLARLYHLTGDELYAQVFWQNTAHFLGANPPYLGVHWVSAQEAALRLIALAFCYHVFRNSVHTTRERSAMLAQAIADHAGRIPASLSYARSQNNNHLVNEAAGLYTAGIILPDYPKARSWRETGWRWLNRALQEQIAADGSYVQHSANYHRLILHTALWVAQIAASAGEAFPEATVMRLRASTHWLLALLDGPSGRLPNLGPNDGACLFPLTGCSFEDYRPVLQAAALAFLGYTPLQAGPWDELRFWLCGDISGMASDGSPDTVLASTPDRPPHRLDNPSKASWAYLRVASFDSRPGHADQLHLDLWWQGHNLAQDAGSYLYNDPPPWDNVLARTAAHNTLSVDGMDQMTPAGRFLWLDWAQARLVEHASAEDGGWERLTAQHDGYRRLGATHRRSVTCLRDGDWLVEDMLLPISGGSHSRLARLHWLLPDWPWQLDTGGEQTRLVLSAPPGEVELTIRSDPAGQPVSPAAVSLARAGKLVAGAGQIEPWRGWASLTYAHKIPALSLIVEQAGQVPIRFTTHWRLP